MSGGSLDYLWSKIDMALEDPNAIVLSSPERIAFKEHMKKVIIALYNVEMIDSGDNSPGSDVDSLLDVLFPNIDFPARWRLDSVIYKKEFPNSSFVYVATATKYDMYGDKEKIVTAYADDYNGAVCKLYKKLIRDT